MNRSFVMLGGTGDLTGRLLLPGLAELAESGGLGDDVVLLAVDRKDWSEDQYRDWARDRLATFAGHVAEDVRAGLVGRLGFQRGDVTDSGDLRTALERAGGVPVIYLALPNVVFLPTLEALEKAAIPDGSTIVVEKPFGRNGDDARKLNEVLHRLVPEERVFRNDHFMAMQTVLNILGLRFANRIFEPVWNASHIERVDIVFDEKLGLEGRAGYYDRAGALRDMLQNHLLQQLALIAMEPPLSVDGGDLAARKGDVLRAVRPPSDMKRDTVRGRYTAGTIDGRKLPDYTAEEGVDPSRETETYAEYTITIDNWRWAGVPFRLRSGKALGDERKHIEIHFRPVPHQAFRVAQPHPGLLRLNFAPDGIGLELNLNGEGDPFELERRTLDIDLPRRELSAYGLLLKEIANADLTGNVFSHNTVGLFADGATRLVAEHNDFVNNGWALRLEASTDEATFARNNFAGNTFDVATNSRSTDNVFARNYWSAYDGYDLNHDGIGDVAFRPVKLSSVIVAQNEPALILLRSTFLELLDAAERVIPALTPEALSDSTPSMRWNR